MIAIGPVQEFIAAARKTRDLWAGSWLLSEVCRAAAVCLRDAGAELVFPPPGVLNDGDARAVPNRLVALTPSNLEPALLARRAREQATDRLVQFAQGALARAGQIVDSQPVNSHLQDFLEFYAAWYPWARADLAYGSALEQADLLLAGRKALRDFRQATDSRGKPKSSLDGGRQTVLLESARPQWASYGIKPGEQLDGVSFVKRVAEPRRFVSVSRVAADPLIRRLDRDHPERLRRLGECASRLFHMQCPAVTPFSADDWPQYRAFPYDCDLIYLPRQADRELAEWSGDDRQRAEALDDFAATLRSSQLSPTPYLAVIHADGDRMGAAIRTLSSPEEHRALSAALSDFAEEAERIVTKHQGALVYTGGDDVLAFVPLDRAVDCAEHLAGAFAAKMSEVFRGTSAGAELAPTLSVGVSINHYGEHLGEMVGWARDAERTAKRERNSLAVALHTRTAGPEAVEITSRWSEGPAGRLRLWVALHRADALPDRAVFDLSALERELRGITAAMSPEERRHLLAQVLPCEVRRILARKEAGHGRAKLSPRVYDAAVRLAGSTLESLGRTVAEMLVARRLTDAAELAGSEPAEVEAAIAAVLGEEQP